MSETWKKYAGAAAGWTTEQYADSNAYLARRADLVRTLGPRVEPGDRVLDLACGDGGFADFLPELRYVGVDASPEMVAEARARGRDVMHADVNDYVPPAPVEVTTMFRAIYYAHERRAFLRHVGSYTTAKFVFDLNPRQFPLEEIAADLRAAGFDRLELQPFFAPQTVALPGAAMRLLRGVEGVRPLARLLLTRRFSYVCAASRSAVR